MATVYVAKTDKGRHLEFVESLQPPFPKDKKWVLIVSSLYGCPVGCRFCDAGGFYQGKISKDDMLRQIDYLVRKSYADGKVPATKFKIQFARMGEPALNPAVLDVLEELPFLYSAPGLLPTVSTIAPAGTEPFFERLRDIKDRFYKERFQLQFSVHSTDESVRDWLMPIKKWRLADIAAYGSRFHRPNERKITLNFALAEGFPVEPAVLLRHFDPSLFFIKITPVNPTRNAWNNGILSVIHPKNRQTTLMDELKLAGFEVLLSIGEWEENNIGSNCGQQVLDILNGGKSPENAYTYSFRKMEEEKEE
ncbi:MAG: radical SAM protein [Candidatus Aminicenantes bacterium]|nr:radical SAM protein [Candidatus Aminicenantes bacterium]